MFSPPKIHSNYLRWWDANSLIVVVSSQHIHMSNHHGVRLKLTECYTPIIPQQSWELWGERSILAVGKVWLYSFEKYNIEALRFWEICLARFATGILLPHKYKKTFTAYCFKKEEEEMPMLWSIPWTKPWCFTLLCPQWIVLSKDIHNTILLHVTGHSSRWDTKSRFSTLESGLV